MSDPDPDSGPVAGPADAIPDAADGPGADDDVRRRFRAALERKQGRHTDAAAAQGDRPAGPTGRTSGGKTPRMFRRRSGG